MQIGMVAKKIGLSVDAIRFYERNALVPRAPRSQGGFRQYGENDVETLAFIRRVQGLGFKLSEIRGAETARESPTALCSRAAPSGREAGRCAEETCRPESPKCCLGDITRAAKDRPSRKGVSES